MYKSNSKREKTRRKPVPSPKRVYNKATAENPTTARATAALPLYLIAPLLTGDALGDAGAEALALLPALALAPELGLAPELALAPPVLAIAAAWNAANVLFALELTANTIPCSQCLKHTGQIDSKGE